MGRNLQKGTKFFTILIQHLGCYPEKSVEEEKDTGIEDADVATIHRTAVDNFLNKSKVQKKYETSFCCVGY